ncbi:MULTISPECIES: ABC-2 transporter permease [unclassified Curtobacterium]|jgi:hypothetical protein|uniref:ABC-2 transporter permease n=1 Tax=unclassified Curtobacterium TaxID=257496 RepID=UPI002864FDBB|nr:ABC-2 transporter permease [Curtobacterium sp. 320]MDR6573578.1 hypothetical protein [Curtobacterium sp. 320]
MTAVLQFARFDLRTMALTQPLRVLLPLLFTVVFCVTLPVPGFGIAIGAVVATVSASIPFQGDERGRLDTLYGIAPIGRTAVVLGRYCSMTVFALTAIGVGTATTLVMRVVRHQDFGWPLVGTMLLASLACVGVAYAVQLPWFFALGFTRGRPMIYIPVGIIAVAGTIVGRSGWFATPRSIDVLVPPLWLVALVFAAVLVLLVSAGIAMRVYRRREL